MGRGRDGERLGAPKEGRRIDAPKNALLPPAAYVNFLQVAAQRSEIFLAFGQAAQEQGAGAHLVSSLVTSPVHAKSMLRALSEAIAGYEARFGEIEPAAPAAAPGGPAARPRGA